MELLSFVVEAIKAFFTPDFLVSGVLSGIVASLSFLGIMRFIRPRISVADKICMVGKDADGKNIYRIKVVNRSKVMLKNPKYVLECHTPRPNGNFDNAPMSALKPDMLYIDKYNRQDVSASYAVTFSYYIPDEKLADELCSYEFIFTAEHPFSNTAVCKKKKYTCDDIVPGKFRSGKSTEIIEKKVNCENFQPVK